MKKRVWLAKGYGTFQTAWRTLQGIEAVHMIRKGRVRWLPKRDAVGQALLSPGCSGSPPNRIRQLTTLQPPESLLRNFATEPSLPPGTK